jgi:hypothetical protein
MVATKDGWRVLWMVVSKAVSKAGWKVVMTVAYLVRLKVV